MIRRYYQGSVYKRKDGRWVVAHPVAGHVRGRRYLYFGTKLEAENALRELHSKWLSPALSKSMPLRQYLAAWLDLVVKPTTKESTYLNTESFVRRHIIPVMGEVALNEITPQAILAVYAACESQRMPVATRRTFHDTLHNSLGQAVRWGILHDNPISHVRKPRAHTPAIQVLTEEQISVLFRAAESSRLYALYVLAVTTGMRLGELLALQWTDIHWGKQTVMVLRSLGDVRGRLKVGETKTPGSRRSVTLPLFAMQAMRLHRERMRAEGNLGEYVFVTTTGTLISRANFHRVCYKPLLERAGLPDISFHALRHTSATVLLALGVHPKIVAERLGHSSAMTLNTYGHSIPIMQTAAVKEFSNLFRPLQARHGKKTR